MNNPSIRRSQLITTFGPGALVNLVNGSYIGMGIDHWPPSARLEDRIYDDRLQKRLGKKFFVQPPSNEVNKQGLPYRRFPRWFFCPHNACRILQTYEKWEERNPRRNHFKILVCPDHAVPLVPMNFLVACLDGHIDDFPWVEWVHSRSDTDCSRIAPLKYLKGLSGAGLGGMVIKCTACNASRDMRGSFSPEAFGEYVCTGSKPWAGKEAGHCGKHLVALQRGGSNVYFPKIVSSIAIPSPFNNLIEEIKRTDGWLALSSFTSLGAEMFTPEARTQIIEQIASDINRNLEEVQQFIERYGGDEEEKVEVSEENYLYDEYAAFHGNFNRTGNESRDFKVQDATGTYNYRDFGIKSVIMVEAIREVRALVGFTRIKPLDSDEETPDESTAEKPRLVDLSERRLNWLPAMEARGEGIFITFDEKKLEDWSKKPSVQKRLVLMNRHYEDSRRKRGLSFSPLSAKQVLLHTFAHLLIRQLSFECGYSSASLRERIYCDSGGKTKMQGILIYTAAGDADGTLGGLVRQAREDRFPQTLRSVLTNSVWCSNDPLCLESKGQGFESQNLAACYACCLLPETSCETFNRFLDRALVVGLPGDTSPSFFKDLIEHL